MHDPHIPEVVRPASDDAYIVGKIMDIGTKIAEAIVGASEKSASLTYEAAKLESVTAERIIEAEKEGRRAREITLRIVIPMCVVGLFAFLGYAISEKMLEDAVAALPQLIMAFAFVALLWKLTPKRKVKTHGHDDDN